MWKKLQLPQLFQCNKMWPCVRQMTNNVDINVALLWQSFCMPRHAMQHENSIGKMSVSSKVCHMAYDEKGVSKWLQPVRKKKSDKVYWSRFTVFVSWYKSTKNYFLMWTWLNWRHTLSNFCHPQSYSVLHSAMRHSMDAPLYCTKPENYIRFRALRCQKYTTHQKNLQIKVVRNWISYKKVCECICLSATEWS